MQLIASIYKLLLFVICASLFSTYSIADSTKLRSLERRQQLYPSNLKVKYVLARAYANRGKADPRFFDKSINGASNFIL